MPSFCFAKKDDDNYVRGVWVSTVSNLDFPSKSGLSEKQLKKELNSVVATCVSLKLNTVFFQVRPTADALYKSDIFPWSKVISGTQGKEPDNGFDPFRYLSKLCDKNNLSLHAWINPYRVCKIEDLPSLSNDNPAVKHPEYTVSCSDGNVYFNPALKDVRKLIVDGVLEILDNYDIDGIHFDDYFYPYGVSDYPDSEDYLKYGSDFTTVGDFRRNNVNLLVKEVSAKVRAHKSGAVFGISPFGIWDNKKDNPNGSDTSGMSSFNQIYADSRLWVVERWVDYICPQVYWSFENSAAPFEAVVRWWDDLCKKADVDLYIGHAVYKLGSNEKGFSDANQIEKQLALCSSLDSVDGSVFFRYKNLADNLLGCNKIINSDYKDEQKFNIIDVPETPPVKAEKLHITSPQNGYTTTDTYCSVSGYTDPTLKLTVNGNNVNLTDNGYFSVYLPLEQGRNNFVFSNGEETKSVTIKREPVKNLLPDCFYEKSAFPIGESVFSPMQVITLSVKALPSVKAYAVVGDDILSLEESVVSDTQSVYSVDVLLPDIVFEKEMFYGEVSFYAIKDGVRYDYNDKSRISVSNDIGTRYTSDECYVYDSVYGGSMMDNYQLHKGSVLNACSYSCDHYQTKSGKWVSAQNVVDSFTKSKADIKKNNYQKLKFISDSAFESYAFVDDFGILHIELYDVLNGKAKSSDALGCLLLKNGNNYEMIIKDDKAMINGFCLERTDHNTLNIYVYKSDNGVKGKKIVIDPGHGGSDCGALGPMGEGAPTESDLNLSMSILIANKLAQMGADVRLLRSEDVAVPLNDRPSLAREKEPDLFLSVHHNSLGYSSDFNKSSGPIVFYSRETALDITKRLAESLGCEYRKQSLNVCRDYRYPCVLIECGFVCNPDEYELLLTNSFKEPFSNNIVTTICSYFNKNS